MHKPKPHLKDVYRTHGKTSRIGKLRLDMNESVSGLPAGFVKKVLSQIDSELLSAYPEYDALQKKIALHNGLEPENICLSNGSDAAIKYIFDAYICSQDKILFCEPTFAMYAVYCKIFNAKPITLVYDSDLNFPKRKFINRISKDIKMAIIANPNNPTGTILSQNEIIEIVEKAKNNDVIMVVDEAYFYFYPKTSISKIKKYDNLIVLRTFSKLCGIASLRLGYAAANAKIIGSLVKVRPAFDINGLAVTFARNILDSPDIISSLIDEVDEGKRYLAQNLSQMGIEYKDTCANFILINCLNRAKEIMEGLSKNNILVSGGFKQIFLKDYIRVTVGSKVCMQRFWKIFKDIWQNQQVYGE